MDSVSRLRALWPNLPVATEESERLREELIRRWSSADRSYHNLTHLLETLESCELLYPSVECDRLTVSLAAWFHDAVYEGLPTDEEKSAVLARDRLRELGLGTDLVEEVARLVLLTRDHRPEPHDLNGGVLSDGDLAILAAPEKRYREYTEAVRREYAAVEDGLFRVGRAEVLEKLLSKPYLYHTSVARDLWEAGARANVELELGRLKA